MGWYLATAVGTGMVLFWFVLKSRNLHLWLPGYVKGLVLKKRPYPGPGQQVYVCIADHYEPYFGGASPEEAHELVRRWMTGYRDVAARHSDSRGRMPQYSYFYPVEEYDEWVLDQIAEICAQGMGDVDIHLHHDDDTAENLATTLNDFKHLLHQRHGLLRKDSEGRIVYGFIHGNWALDNSRPDGKWCGVDNELDVLVDTGCVYDMTMPSAPSDTQIPIINSIYFARDDGRPRSHAKGRLAGKGRWRNERELLMIQGPLTLNWQSRKFGLLPRIENGELSADMPPAKRRVKLWRGCAISVQGCEEHVFIKLYTHGLQRQNLEMFFDQGGFETLFTDLEAEFRDQDNISLNYVTAWEMYQKIESLCLDRDDSVAESPVKVES